MASSSFGETAYDGLGVLILLFLGCIAFVTIPIWGPIVLVLYVLGKLGQRIGLA